MPAGTFPADDRQCEGPLKHQSRLRLTPEEFALTRERKVATFLGSEDIDIQGRNLLGRVSAWVAEAAFARILQSTAVVEQVSQASEGAVELAWPRVIVHLEKVEQLQPVLTFQVLGFSLTDVLVFGPLRVEKDYAYLKVDLAIPRRQDRTPS